MEEKETQVGETRKKKMDRRKIELVLFFVVGVLFGISVKTEAHKTITMGFDDYLIPQRDTVAYDLNEVQKKVSASGASTIGSGAGLPQGGSCGQ